MSDTESPNLSLPYIMAAQAQKHVTHNEAIRSLDALVQLVLLDRDLSAPPPAPVDGSRYIVGSSPTGMWAGNAKKIAAFQDGAWVFFAPGEGWVGWVTDENMTVVFNGTDWVLSAVASVNPAPLIGVNATADVVNRLSVASDAVLLNHAGAGHQLKINKNTPADTATVLFQSGFSGRAELGLAGDENVRIKVSPDGVIWKDALVIDRSTGAINHPFGAGQYQVDVFTASGSWTKPVWARTVRIVLMGGGAGGSSGRRGAAGTDRRGGGGGSSAGIVDEQFPASELPAILEVDVASGGAGGAGVGVDNTNGNNGGNGGNSVVRDGLTTILTASGGLGPTGGGLGTGGTGGAGWVSSFGQSNGGGSSTTLNAGQGTYWTSGRAGGGGGGGGSINSSNAPGTGGSGAEGYFIGGVNRRANAVAGGAVQAAGASGNPKAWQRGTGSGGGGGGAGNAAGTLPGGMGGGGGVPGGGAGGGGASTNGAMSGAGGVGGRGECWIISAA